MSSATREVVRRTAVGFLLLYGVILGIGLLLTRVLAHDWPVSSEDAVNRDLAARRTPALDAVTWVWSEVGNTVVVVAVLGVVMLACRLAFKRWNEALFVLLATLGQSVVFLFVQLVVERRRPDVPHLDDSPPTSSFPSGHTSASVALYGSTAAVLLWRTRRSWLPVVGGVLLLLLPFAVAWSRLYRGMHHPTDVATSLVNGTACIALSWQAFLAEGRPVHDLRGRLPLLGQGAARQPVMARSGRAGPRA